MTTNKAPLPKKLTPKEAIYAFITYLSSRQLPIILSAKHNKAALSPIISDFSRLNKFPDVRDRYEEIVVLPTNSAHDQITNDPALASAGVARTYNAREALDVILPIVKGLPSTAQMTVMTKIFADVKSQHEERIKTAAAQIGEGQETRIREQNILATLDKIAKGEIIVIL